MKTRYDAVFANAAREGRGIFVPFVMLGDPDAATSLAVVRTLIAAGADALELGFPYSDPSADGPVIEAASTRALSAGIRTQGCFALIEQIRTLAPAIPIGLLVYANLVVARGIDRFYAEASRVGVDAVLVADVPLAEAAPFSSAARAHQVAPVFIAPPNVDEARLARIATEGAAFTYVVSRAGVTGADATLQTQNSRVLARLRELGAPAPLLGFGISRPEHVRQAVAQGAAGAISGSAVVSRVARIASGEVSTEIGLAEIGAFVAEMVAAIRQPRSAAVESNLPSAV